MTTTPRWPSTISRPLWFADVCAEDVLPRRWVMLPMLREGLEVYPGAGSSTYCRALWGSGKLERRTGAPAGFCKKTCSNPELVPAPAGRGKGVAGGYPGRDRIPCGSQRGAHSQKPRRQYEVIDQGIGWYVPWAESLSARGRTPGRHVLEPRRRRTSTPAMSRLALQVG